MKPSKRKRKLLIAAVIGSLLLPSTARANDVKECITKCEAALADQDKVINLKTRQIEAQKDIIAAQDVRVAQLEKEKGGLFSSPWFYVAIGFAAGALIVRGK